MEDHASGNLSFDEHGDIFYVVHNTPITYSYFILNVLMIVAHVMSIALNSCMIEAIRRSRKVEEPGGHCLISLSAAYIWHGLMMIYTAIYGMANMQQLYECLIRFGIVNSSFILISWANCFLTFDRYLQIEFPFWYKKHMQIKTVWISNLIAVILAIFYGISTLIFGWYVPKEETNRLNICEYFQILPNLYLQIFYAITFAGIPLTVAAYIRLLYIARRHKLAVNKLPRSYPAKQAAKDRKRKWRPVKIVLTICAVYVFCWSIPGIYGFILTLDQQDPQMDETYLSVMAGLIMVPSLSGFINPCIYTLHRDVKKKFLQIICCRKKRNNDFEASIGSNTSTRSASVVTRMKRILTESYKTPIAKLCCATPRQDPNTSIRVNDSVQDPDIPSDINESSNDITVPSEEIGEQKNIVANAEEFIEMTDIASNHSSDPNEVAIEVDSQEQRADDQCLDSSSL